MSQSSNNRKLGSLRRNSAANTIFLRQLFTIGIGPPKRSRYGGMETSDVKRLKDLEEENARLKKMYADLSLDNHILKELFTKKGWALPQKGN